MAVPQRMTVVVLYRSGRSEKNMTEIIVDGIVVSVTKKAIKNMYIRIVPPDGEVRLTAPYSMGDDDIRSFAVSRLPWIRKHKAYFREWARQPRRKYVTGESYYVWGKEYSLDVRGSEAGSPVHVEGDTLVLPVAEDSTFEQRERILNEWLRNTIKEMIPEMLERCEKVVGVRAKEWRVRNMRTRWGTCNIQKRRIWLNLQLAKKPPECLEYVIIHELVHLLERNHNTKFYKYMDKFYPDWRAVKDRLNHET